MHRNDRFDIENNTIIIVMGAKWVLNLMHVHEVRKIKQNVLNM